MFRFSVLLSPNNLRSSLLLGLLSSRSRHIYRHPLRQKMLHDSARSVSTLKSYRLTITWNFLNFVINQCRKGKLEHHIFQPVYLWQSRQPLKILRPIRTIPSNHHLETVFTILNGTALRLRRSRLPQGIQELSKLNNWEIIVSK